MIITKLMYSSTLLRRSNSSLLSVSTPECVINLVRGSGGISRGTGAGIVRSRQRSRGQFSAPRAGRANVHIVYKNRRFLPACRTLYYGVCVLLFWFFFQTQKLEKKIAL